MYTDFDKLCNKYGVSAVDFNSKSSSDPVAEFENKIADFFGAPYAVSTDSCTHGLELCLRYVKADHISCPAHTYLSVPMLANKLNIELMWYDSTADNEWDEFYYVYKNIFDAAVLWRRGSYLAKTFMCLSFQYQKHLSLGRGGMILCPDKESALQLKKMSYDGRLPGIPWREQGDITTQGYHYYLIPELAELGLSKLQAAIDTPPKIWTIDDYPDISKYSCFK